jgi:alpha-beta hydrolase superfamily lysophospholipase
MNFAIPHPPKQLEPALISPRGAHLATRLWLPWSSGRNVKAICLLVSGEYLHSGYFEGLAGRLNREGIVVVAYDLVGTGYSGTEPGSHTTECFHIDSMDCWIEDVFAAAVWAKERVKASENTPMFLLGESVGGIQVLAAALDRKAQTEHKVKVSGVIALSAMMEPAPGLLPSRFVIKMLSLFSPCFPQLKLPPPEVIPNFDEAFGNRDWALAARTDPMVPMVPRPTLSTARAMITGAERIELKAKSFELPILAIHALKDSRAVFTAVQKLVDRVGSRAEGRWIEETTGHHLLQDHREVSEQVKEKIATWIAGQLNTGEV